MSRILLVLLFLLPLAATAAHADPLFDFKLSGGGHTYQFVLPNPPGTYDYPHGVYAQLRNEPGMVDGVNGYRFQADFLLDGVCRPYCPLMQLFITPPASATWTPTDLNLDGPFLTAPFLTPVTYVPVTYNPVYPFGGLSYDYLLVSQFLPGKYAFESESSFNEGYNEPYPVELTITPDTSSTVPEPSTWVLLATGAAAAALALQRRRFPSHT